MQSEATCMKVMNRALHQSRDGKCLPGWWPLSCSRSQLPAGKAVRLGLCLLGLQARTGTWKQGCSGLQDCRVELPSDATPRQRPNPAVSPDLFHSTKRDQTVQ